MLTHLEQLMSDANALAGQIQGDRLRHAYQAQSRTDLDNLESRRLSKAERQNLEVRLAQTWTAIRLARLAPVVAPMDLGHRPTSRMSRQAEMASSGTLAPGTEPTANGRLYEQYGQGLEAEHAGEYVAIFPEGTTVVGPQLLDVLARARQTAGVGSFIFRVAAP